MHWKAGAACLLAGCSLFTNLDGLEGAEGGAGGNLVDERFDGQFALGTFTGTQWVGDHVELAPGVTKGDFVSRIYDSNAAGAWKSLSWTPGAPYGKPLPDQAGVESGYRADGFDMTSNVTLLHFDGSLVDTSPAQSPFSGTSVGGFVQGVFGQALSDTAQGYVHANVAGSSSVFNFGTSSFSWAMWANSTALCPNNAVYMGIENPNTGYRPHLWLGCTPGSTSTIGVLGDTFCSDRLDAPVDCVAVQGTTTITDGAWHLLSIVKSGQAPVTISAYVDGVLQGSAIGKFAQPLVFDTGVEFAIGALSKGTYPAEGTFDEVAIWDRALTPAEMGSLYRRGALRLTFQVRACDDPACASAQFVGPGGDPAASFVDPPNVLGPPSDLPVLASGRWVQYRAHLESIVPGASPALYAVSVAR